MGRNDMAIKFTYDQPIQGIAECPVGAFKVYMYLDRKHNDMLYEATLAVRRIDSADDDHSIVVVVSREGFRNTVNDVRVTYNNVIGTLTSPAGYLPAGDWTFQPTNLVPKGIPWQTMYGSIEATNTIGATRTNITDAVKTQGEPENMRFNLTFNIGVTYVDTSTSDI